MPRNKIGKELRPVTSVRVEPFKLEIIKKVYGSLAKFIDLKFKKDPKLKENL